MLIQYDRRLRFGTEATDWLNRAIQVVEEYDAMNIKLSLRQVFYQFVARNWFANEQKNYKKLGDIISRGRQAGRISWYAIEDRERNLVQRPAWNGGPAAFLQSVIPQHRKSMWLNQDVRLEVMIEKNALLSTISNVCREFDIPYIGCKGYMSQTEEWEAGRRILQAWEEREQETIVLYLGDHDPSGLDMTRDHVERLSMFAEMEVEVVRLALNMDQIQHYNPPPNPARQEDARFAGYQAQFGDESWELDALDPPVIAQLIRDAVEQYRDEEKWDEMTEEIAAERAQLQRFVQWNGGFTAFQQHEIDQQAGNQTSDEPGPDPDIPQDGPDPWDTPNGNEETGDDE